MDFQCPSCQKVLTVPDQYRGAVMKCPLCRNIFQATPALPPKEIRAQAFILTDASGRTQARLAATQEGPVLTLYGAEGKARAEVRVDAAGPFLRLLDEEGRPVPLVP
jgi:hypothetical protein